MTGISYDGGYADYLVAPATALATVPRELAPAAVARGTDTEPLARRLRATHSIDARASDPAAELAKAAVGYERMMSGKARFRVVLTTGHKPRGER